MEATTADGTPSGGSPLANRLDRYFDVTARGSSIPTEVRAGAATFLTMAYILFFDTAGTVLGLGRRAGLVTPDGRLPGMRRVLIVDSLAAAGGGAASASSNTTFIESSAGIGEGARTGAWPRS